MLSARHLTFLPNLHTMYIFSSEFEISFVGPNAVHLTLHTLKLKGLTVQTTVDTVHILTGRGL